MNNQEEKNKQSILTDINEKEDDKSVAKLLDKESKFDGLTPIKILGYGVGHFINDLVAACWFNYLFFFLKQVVKTPAASAAILSGQIFDGLATPIVGILSDKYTTRWGQRTPWYIFGLVLVVICYLPIYHTFNSDNKLWEYAYYITFPSLFNVGWASLQISHMSLVPSLTCSRKRRDKLNNLRNSFTFLSNFVVLGLGLIVFSLMDQPSLQYEIISYVVVVCGITASIFFLYQIREVKLSEICVQKAQIIKDQIGKKSIENSRVNQATEFSSDEQGQVYLSNRLAKKKQSIFDWFKMPKFYFFGLCYMGVRLATNMFGTMLPFYLVGVIHLGKQEDSSNHIPFTVALVPLIVYLSSVLSSLSLNKFYLKFGRKSAVVFGTVLSGVCFAIMILLTQSSNWIMYIIAFFIGISQTMILSTGINFISDVVGAKAKTGAFVFGIYSLLDKFSAGIVIFLIGQTEAYSTDLNELTIENQQFIRYTMCLIPSLSAVLSALIVVTYPVEQYKKKKKGAKAADDKNQQFIG